MSSSSPRPVAKQDGLLQTGRHRLSLVIAESRYSDDPLTLAMKSSLERQLILSLCLFVTCFTLFFSQAAITDNADGQSMFEVTKSFVETGRLAIDPHYGFPGRGGKFYASHGIGLPMIAVLPYVASRPLAGVTSLGNGNRHAEGRHPPPTRTRAEPRER